MRTAIHAYKRFPANSSFILALIGAGVLAGVLVVFSPNALPWIAGLMLMFVGSYPLIKAIRGRDVDLFQPIYPFTAYFVLLMGIRGLWDLRFGSAILDPLFDRDSLNSFMTLVFLYSALSLTFLYMGYYSKVGAAIANLLPKLPRIRWTKLGTTLAAVFSFCTGALAIAWSHRSGIHLMQEGAFWLYCLAFFPLIGLAMLYIDALAKGATLRAFTWAFVIVITAFLLFGISWKTVILDGIALLLVPYHYLRNRFSIKRIAFVSMTIIIASPLLFWYHAGLRSLGDLQHFLTSNSTPYQVITPLMNRSHGADSFAVILRMTPEVYDFQYGATLAQLFSWFVPRRVWPEKPPTFSLRFGTTYMEYTKEAGPFVTPSFVGELYINFSWLGIMLGSFLTGLGFKVLYTYLIKNQESRTTILLYGLALPRLIFLAEGPIAEMMSRLLISVFSAAALLIPMALVGTLLGANHLASRRL
jgi:hypothetical protein